MNVNLNHTASVNYAKSSIGSYEYLERNFDNKSKVQVSIVTFGDVADEWLSYRIKSKALALSTIKGYKTLIKVLKRLFGEDIFINEISRKMVFLFLMIT